MLMVFYPLAAIRWLHFLSVYVLFGASFFWFYMGAQRSSSGPGGLPRTLHATSILLRIAAPIAAITGICWLACILINSTDDVGSVVNPEDLQLFFFETPFGLVSMVRIALLFLAVIVAALPWTNRAWFSALLHIAAVLLITQGYLGHAAEGGAGLYGAIMITTYSIHMFAAAAWVGGLPPLLFALVEQRHFNPHEAREWTVDILLRYSAMAMVALALIVATGIANAGFRVAGSFDKLFDTSYGDVLFTKVGIVVVMLVLAYFNRFIALPRLREASLKGMEQINRLRFSTALELVLGIAVLGAAAVLGITPPPQ